MLKKYFFEIKMYGTKNSLKVIKIASGVVETKKFDYNEVFNYLCEHYNFNKETTLISKLNKL